MHQARGALHFAAVDGTEALMAEADAQDGDTACKVTEGFVRNAGVIGIAGPGGDHEGGRVERDQFLEGDLVVAEDADLARPVRRSIGRGCR